MILNAENFKKMFGDAMDSKLTGVRADISELKLKKSKVPVLVKVEPIRETPTCFDDEKPGLKNRLTTLITEYLEKAVNPGTIKKSFTGLTAMERHKYWNMQGIAEPTNQSEIVNKIVDELVKAIPEPVQSDDEMPYEKRSDTSKAAFWQVFDDAKTDATYAKSGIKY